MHARFQLVLEPGLAGKDTAIQCTATRRVSVVLRSGSKEKLRELIDKTPTKLTLADCQGLDEAIAHGRGGLYLELSREQYGEAEGFLLILPRLVTVRGY